MAMGKRKPKQEPLFFSAQEIPKAASHPFYAKVNEILERNKVDKRLEHLCKWFYKPVTGRPSMIPGFTSECFCLATLKELIRNAGLRGAWQTGFRCGSFWDSA